MKLEILQLSVVTFSVLAVLNLCVAINRNSQYRQVVVRLFWIFVALTFGAASAVFFHEDASIGFLGRFARTPTSRTIFGVLFAIAGILVMAEGIFASNQRLLRYADNILARFYEKDGGEK